MFPLPILQIDLGMRQDQHLPRRKCVAEEAGSQTRLAEGAGSQTRSVEGAGSQTRLPAADDASG